MPRAKQRELLCSEFLGVGLCTDCAHHFYTQWWITLPEFRGEEGLCLFMHTALTSDIPSHLTPCASVCPKELFHHKQLLKIIYSEALVPSCVFQVLEDGVVDSLTKETFQAACLLFEFSASGRMWPACRYTPCICASPGNTPLLPIFSFFIFFYERGVWQGGE